jgi:hypothetical protein
MTLWGLGGRSGGEEEGRKEVEGRNTEIPRLFSSERKGAEIGHLKINQSLHDYVSSHLRNPSLFSNLFRWRAPIWSSIVSFWILLTLGTSLETSRVALVQ